MAKKHIALLAVVVIIAAGTAAGMAGLGGSDTNPSVGSVSFAYPDRIIGGIQTGNGSPVLGDALAPVTIVEFGDYQCHFCKKWHHETLPLIKNEYIDSGRVNLVFVDYAFLGNDSPKAAHASYCADDQGMYWSYHDELYNSQHDRIDGGWASDGNLHAFARDIGLDMDEFVECMSSSKYRDRVASNTQIGTDMGVEATPTFFIIGHDGDPVMIPGAQPYGTFVRVINSAS